MQLLNLSGVDSHSVNSLKYIHIAGTKGKGSTCAYTESILRRCGLKTGFCSSPHMVEVRERIRINGKPLEYSVFADHFMDFYVKFPDSIKKNIGYAQLLTMLAFRVFLEESVDVAILEVGIGGRYDFTNIIRNPSVCGITLLDYDHCHILGNTIREIAHQKAGIFKPQTPAFTIRQFYQEAHEELILCADQLNCQLDVVPFSENVKKSINAGFGEDVLGINASLAVKLAQTFTGDHFVNDDLPKPYHEGLRECAWPGRFQIIRRGVHTFLLDGAHTALSIQALKLSYRKYLFGLRSDVKKILVVWISGHREPEFLLEPLTNFEFDCVIFTSPFSSDDSLDVQNLNINPLMAGEKTNSFRDVWTKLMNSKDCSLNIKCPNDMNNITFGGQLVYSSPCLSKTFKLIESLSDDEHCHVLVTGSLYLVGAFLSYFNQK